MGRGRVLALSLPVLALRASAMDNGLARLPPMGWSSVRATAGALTSVLVGHQTDLLLLLLLLLLSLSLP